MVLGVGPLHPVVFKEAKEIGLEVFDRSCIKFSQVTSVLMNDCQRIEQPYVVNEEKQISKWFVQKMKPYLKASGYEVREHCIRSEFSKFGNAIVDFEVFVNDSHTWSTPEIVEFKNKNINNDKIYQTFASMVKAGTDRAMAAILFWPDCKRSDCILVTCIYRFKNCHTFKIYSGLQC